MKRKASKWMSLLLTLTMALSLLPTPAAAVELEEPTDLPPQEEVVTQEAAPQETADAPAEEEAVMEESTAIAERAAAVPAVPGDFYGYSKLTDETEKNAYAVLLDGMRKKITEIDISAFGLSEAQLKKVVKILRNDDPTLYQLEGRYGVSQNGKNEIVNVKPQYSSDTFNEDSFNTSVEELLRTAEGKVTDYEKALALHDVLVKKVTYDPNAAHAHNAYGAIVDGKAVCEGYARAYQHLLRKAGIQSYVVTGTGNGQSHAWNLVKLDGAYYYADVTWDDPTTRSPEEEATKPIYHAYFAIGDTDFKKEHIAQSEVDLDACPMNKLHPDLETLDTLTVDAVAATIKRVGENGVSRIYYTGTADFGTWWRKNYQEVLDKATVKIVGGTSVGLQSCGCEYRIEYKAEDLTSAAIPSADFSFDGSNANKLTSTTAQMKYSVDGGNTWKNCTANTTDLSSDLAKITETNDIQVKDMGDGMTTGESGIQTIDITKAAAPTTVTGVDCTSGNDGKLQNVDNTMEYRKEGSDSFISGTGSEITNLEAGKYEIRVKAAGTVLASDVQTVTIKAAPSALTGTVNVSGDVKFGSKLTASVSGSNAGDTLQYKWYRGSDFSTVLSDTNEYTPVKEDIQKTLTCKVTSSDASFSGEITSTTAAVAKADSPAAPAGLTAVKPTTTGGSDGKITGLDSAKIYEYLKSDTAPSDWTDAAQVTGVTEIKNLAIGTYYIRLKETETHLAGQAIALTVSEKTAHVLNGTMTDQTIIYGDTPAVQSVTCSTGSVEYSSSAADVVEVNASTGALTIKKASTAPVTITAKVAETAEYAEASMTYTVTVQHKELEITGLTAADRAYNGTKDVVLTGGTLVGKVGSDDVSVVMPTTGTVASADAEDSKEVTVAMPTLEGAAAGNYTLKAISGITVNITKATPDIGEVSYGGAQILYPSTKPADVTLVWANSASVPGTLKLTDTALTSGTKDYNWTFTPADPKNYETVTGKVSLTVKVDALTSITIETPPTKTTYKFGETFDPTDMKVNAHFDSGAEIDVTDQVSYKTDKLVMTDTEITISYTSDDVTKTADQAITMSKAAPRTLPDVAITQKLDLAGEQSKSIGRAGMPDDAGELKYSKKSTTTNGKVDVSDWNVDNTGLVKFTLANGTPDAKVTLTVAINSDNYEESTVDVVITLTDKEVPVVTVEPITVTYTGEAILASAIKGTAKVGDTVVKGTWNWKLNAPVRVADGGTVAVTFNPTETDKYAAVEAAVQVTIHKAKPTGTPSYTKLTAGQKLSDANLGIGSIQPAGGTIQWVEPESTVVAEGASYQWQYTPTDPNNYEILRGSVVLAQSTPKPNPNPNPDGGSSSGGSSSGGGSYNPPSKTETTKNPDGSTTTTVTKADGTKVETTKGTDGSQTVVETKKDGTVITTETDKAGNKTKTVENKDGSSITEVKKTNGTTSKTTVDRHGNTESEVKVSSTAVKEAVREQRPLELPMPPVRAEYQSNDAPVVKVDVPTGMAIDVSVPVTYPTSGTVAVVVHPDGREEILRKSTVDGSGVTFAVNGDTTVKIVDNTKHFADVPTRYWAADNIAFVTARGLYNGTSASAFSPEKGMTRGMLAKVLHNLESNPQSGMGTAFTDVSADTWCKEAVSWAADAGIITGYADGSFHQEKMINREQLAVMLYRYAGSPAHHGTALNFSDANRLSGYAQDAMSWAVENGIIGGTAQGTLNPQGTATRAQVAAMLTRFLNQ